MRLSKHPLVLVLSLSLHWFVLPIRSRYRSKMGTISLCSSQNKETFKESLCSRRDIGGQNREGILFKFFVGEVSCGAFAGGKTAFAKHTRNFGMKFSLQSNIDSWSLVWRSGYSLCGSITKAASQRSHSAPNQYSLTFVVWRRAAGVRLHKGRALKGADRPRCDH